MMEYLLFYKEALLCAAVASALLAVLGVHLASRDRALHSLAISQGSSLGILVCLGWLGFHVESWWFPYMFGLGGGGLVLLLAEKLVAGRVAVPNTYLLSLYMLLLACTYWVIGFFPTLESHFSQAFFGDLVTLSGERLVLMAVISFLGLAVLIVKRKTFVRHTINMALFSDGSTRRWEGWFSALVLFTLVTSIYTLGLLFTVSFLFLPTLVLAWGGRGTMRSHFLKVAILAPISVVAGFAFSLTSDRFSTVPTLVIVLFVVGLLARAVGALLLRRRSC